MSSPIRVQVDSVHRVEVSVDGRDGSVHVGLRRNKRGRPSWFTVGEWRSFAEAIGSVDIDKMVAAALARADR